MNNLSKFTKKINLKEELKIKIDNNGNFAEKGTTPKDADTFETYD